MKRIYDSSALKRDTDDPFTPSASEDENSRRAIDWDAFSHAFMPVTIRNRAIEVTITTDREVYASGHPVVIGIEFHNRLPFPVRLRTDSPKRWTWAVDGVTEASQVPRELPDRAGALSFARNERKRFQREWPQRIRVGERDWESVGTGSYTLEARISRADADEHGLADRTEIEIRE